MPAPRNTPIDIEWLRRRHWWDDVDREFEYDCWEWTKSTGSHGYGQTWDGSRNILAHRAAWVLANDYQIPDDMTVDHLCHNKLCCNPYHLVLLSNQENASRNGHALKTHCPEGHLYDGANTYVQPSNGSRRCRKCATERERI